MPRRKPTEIIEHRISLGPYERHRLDTYILFNNINKVANPLVNILSDVSGLAALVGILEAVGVLNIRKYIKANTPLELWYNQVLEGLYSGFDEANQALDAVLDEMKETGEWLEEKERQLEEYEFPSVRELAEALPGVIGEGVEGFVIGTGKGLLAYPLRLWAWSKTTLQNAPRTPSWVPEGVRWPSGRWST